MADGVIGSQLAQTRPANTTAATAYTATLLTEITLIFVANSTASPVAFRLFHDDDGTTYDQTTALYYDEAIAANTTKVIAPTNQGTGIFVRAGGAIGVRTATNDALTFTLYGRVRESR